MAVEITATEVAALAERDDVLLIPAPLPRSPTLDQSWRSNERNIRRPPARERQGKALLMCAALAGR